MAGTTVTAVGVGVLVIGGGGHALVSIEVLRSCGHDVVGCLTRDGVASADLDRIGSKRKSCRDSASIANSARRDARVQRQNARPQWRL